ncbi:hypothetical protein ACWFMI_14865 [Nocardiopsis terrae]
MLDPDDEPGEDGKLESSLEDTLTHYRQFLQTGEGKSQAFASARFLLQGKPASRILYLAEPRQVSPDEMAEGMRHSLKVDISGKELTPVESLEKQRELLSTIAQELVGQREDARRGEADALVHQRRALRIAAWSLGVAALALLPPVVEIMLKLLGVDF